MVGRGGELLGRLEMRNQPVTEEQLAVAPQPPAAPRSTCRITTTGYRPPALGADALISPASFGVPGPLSCQLKGRRYPRRRVEGRF